MPFLGAHLSVSDGFLKMFETADRIKCSAVQIFAKNQRRWESKSFGNVEVDDFKKGFKSSKVKYVNIHASYLLNLATNDEEIFQKSINNLSDDLKRAEELKIEDVVFHPGNHLGVGEDFGIKRVAMALNIIFENVGYGNILLETTAGQGSSIGYRFEHLRDIIAKVKKEERVFVCYDTCHTFEAGYDIREKESYEKTFEDFDKIIGLKKLKLFHLNDSKFDIGLKKDRHEFIGKGFLGLKPFEFILKDKRFKNHPMVLEVPGDVKDYEHDLKILYSML
uniref:Probable endonuclease 4 n=1 Tax=candidate division WOR-3 bacterium TaxID=2052148 RepID=A0A7C3J5D2_UNCW3